MKSKEFFENILSIAVLVFGIPFVLVADIILLPWVVFFVCWNLMRVESKLANVKHGN